MGFLDDIKKLSNAGKRFLDLEDDLAGKVPAPVESADEYMKVQFKCLCGELVSIDVRTKTPKEATDEIVAHIDRCGYAKNTFR